MVDLTVGSPFTDLLLHMNTFVINTIKKNINMFMCTM